jgi:lysophospholipase L1-like esterase
MNDFGELSRFRAENERLKPPAPGENRVIFFGDSITDNWSLSEYFPGKPYINRGISGQTTSQMLIRFQQDVIALHPAAVVILAGTNDIAGNTGPMRIEDIEANYSSLAELATASGIKLVFSSVTPVHN